MYVGWLARACHAFPATNLHYCATCNIANTKSRVLVFSNSRELIDAYFANLKKRESKTPQSRTKRASSASNGRSNKKPRKAISSSPEEQAVKLEIAKAPAKQEEATFSPPATDRWEEEIDLIDSVEDDQSGLIAIVKWSV